MSHQVAVAAGKACRSEAQVELAVTRGKVPHAGGEQATRCEVVGGQRDPAPGISQIGYQPAIQFVERVGKPGQVLRLGVRSEVDVLGVVAAPVRLDRRAADQYECHTMALEHIEQRLPSCIYAAYAAAVC
jgi:hypothetical protein